MRALKRTLDTLAGSKRRLVTTVAAAGIAATALATGHMTVQAQENLGPLTFTEAQVNSGRGAFGSNCAGCHNTDLSGLDGPPLKGDLFAHWFTGPVSALFDYIHVNMPATDPGSLTPTQAANLTAFILSQNDFVAGDTPLPEDTAVLATMGFHQ